ncbi:hypothetical protein V1502_18725 [Bacillus sp. SCS-153A]|uniref:hypothetical protein n=1 Tax=Rossellomorea sedimentorum TaxID=3115294 RepID=UPI003906ADAF
MNSMTMAESLLVMEKEALKFNYALLHDANVLKMLLPFAKEKINYKGKSEIMEMVNREAKKYKYVPTGRVRRDLLMELSSLYNVPQRNFVTKKDVADQCDRIIDNMYTHMKQTNKKFKVYDNNEYNGNKLEIIIRFQMHSLIDSISDKKINDQQMREIGDSLEDFLKDLPEEQQRHIAEKLGINNITSTTLQKLLATNGTAVVFAAIVQVAGFAFYTTLTTVVAGIFGLVGITLPFAVYVTLTSAVAVIANPLFIVPALLLGGSGLLKWQNGKMKKAIAPVVLMQIMLASDQSLQPQWGELVNG